MLVNEKKNKKIIVTVKSLEEIKEYRKVGVSTFLFPLETFSIGYERTWKLEEINEVQEDKIILINRVLDNKSLDEFLKILPGISCKTYIVEDIGLIEPLKKLGYTVYLFMNHFNCNSASINAWLNYVDSVVVSNELTFSELESITSKVNRPVVLHLLGYNEVMYSRRKLIHNYTHFYHLPEKKYVTIEDKMGSVKFHLVENDLGTVALSNKIYDGKKTLELENVLYYLVNSSFIETTKVLEYLKTGNIESSDSGFLEKKTIYKLKER